MEINWEELIESAYWDFDARHKGYSEWKLSPQTERDAFKAEMRKLLNKALNENN